MIITIITFLLFVFSINVNAQNQEFFPGKWIAKKITYYYPDNKLMRTMEDPKLNNYFFDFKSAALIIKNKEHLKQDGIGLKKILLLKNKSRDSNKAKNNHRND